MIIIVLNTFEQRLIGFLHELLNCSIVTATETTANTSAYKGFNDDESRTANRPHYGSCPSCLSVRPSVRQCVLCRYI